MSNSTYTADKLANLLEGWLRIDDWQDESIAPKELVEATKAALQRPSRIVCLVDGGVLQGVWSNDNRQEVVLIDRDNERAGDVVPDLESVTQNIDPVW